MDEFFQGIPNREMIFTGGELNGHVEKNCGGYERVYEGYGFGERNEEGDIVLEFVLVFDLVIVSCFK